MARFRHPLSSGLVLALLLSSTSPAFAQETASLADLLGHSHVHGLALDPKDSGRLLLATHHGLHALSLDTGAVTPVGESRQDFMGFSVVGQGRFLASGHPAAGGNSGVLLSEDDGVTWSRLSDGVDGPVDFHQMTVSAADPDSVHGVHAGVLQRSRDGGITWEAVAPAPDGLIDLAASTTNPERLFAATEAGLLVTEDGGQNWQPAASWTAPVSFVETGPGEVVHAFVLGEGLVRSDDGALDWTLVSAPFGGDYLLHFATDGTQAFAVTGSGALLASENGGSSWALLGG